MMAKCLAGKYKNKMGFWTKYFSQQIFGKWLGGHIWSADRTAKYREYLKSDAWQRKRYVVLKRDNWTCQYCGAKATQVHHKRYAKYQIGKEPIKWLVSLCRTCHQKQH
jgi:5-methylcytosine-specific restriction endonuclease McrA